jgi:hypothetical protein
MIEGSIGGSIEKLKIVLGLKTYKKEERKISIFNKR